MVAMILMANRGPSAAAWWMTLLIAALFVALFGVAPLLSWMSGLVGQARTRRMVTAATLAGWNRAALERADALQPS